MLSQFPFVIAFFLLSRVFSFQHQELKHTAVRFIFTQWQQHDDITAGSKTLHWLFFIRPFKFSHIFLPVHVLHNSLSPAIQSICLSSIHPDNNRELSHTQHCLLFHFHSLFSPTTYGIALPEHATNFSSNSSLKIHSIHLRIKDIYLALFILELYNFIPLCYSLISEWPCYFTAVISSFLSQHLPAASFSLFTL